MKLSQRSLGTLVLLVLLGVLIGSLAWELLERLLRLLGVDFALTLQEPLRLFDLYVVALSLRANPGTVLGALGGILVFRRL